jgi:hypothetical protein
MSLLLLLHPQTVEPTTEAEAIARRLSWPQHAEEVEWLIQTYDRLIGQDPPS